MAILIFHFSSSLLNTNYSNTNYIIIIVYYFYVLFYIHKMNYIIDILPLILYIKYVENDKKQKTSYNKSVISIALFLLE